MDALSPYVELPFVLIKNSHCLVLAHSEGALLTKPEVSSQQAPHSLDQIRQTELSNTSQAMNSSAFIANQDTIVDFSEPPLCTCTCPPVTLFLIYRCAVATVSRWLRIFTPSRLGRSAYGSLSYRMASSKSASRFKGPGRLSSAQIIGRLSFLRSTADRADSPLQSSWHCGKAQTRRPTRPQLKPVSRRGWPRILLLQLVASFREAVVRLCVASCGCWQRRLPSLLWWPSVSISAKNSCVAFHCPRLYL